jgi:hypothetical protein
MFLFCSFVKGLCWGAVSQFEFRCARAGAYPTPERQTVGVNDLHRDAPSVASLPSPPLRCAAAKPPP